MNDSLFSLKDKIIHGPVESKILGFAVERTAFPVEPPYSMIWKGYSMHNPSSMFEFAGFGEVAETTTQLLSLSLRSGFNTSGRSSVVADGNKSTEDRAGIGMVEQLVFQQAKDYLSAVREGFVLSLRSSDVPDNNQLRYLIDQVLLDWDSLTSELGLDSDEAVTSHSAETDPLAETKNADDGHEPLEPVRQQLLAFGMAAVALGALPRLPSEQITFPHSFGKPPTYADIPAPSSPAEMMVRIEELEEMIWQLMAGHPGDLVQNQYGPVRRTYGFFETSAWLARQEAERFGIKKKSGTLAFF